MALVIESQAPKILAKKPLLFRAAALSAAVHEQRCFLGTLRKTSFLWLPQPDQVAFLQVLQLT